ncbi:MAG: phosphoribosylanthranilate isomerase [Rhizobiaceae bacterium]|nr:phosphoribosylanthranilate isomerase [Rhizobiaceae bacterium]
MTLDIKICGLRTTDAITAATGRGATHVGFIHFEKSPRHLTIAEMAALRPAVSGADLVVVLVDPDDATVEAIARAVRPDMLQLHGRETPERVAKVRALTGLPVMKALSIGTAEDLARVASYRGVADRLLLDAKRPKGSELPGGNGVSFDWRLLAALDADVTYMLSGGLDALNVLEAVGDIRPAGIDVSSGVETSPGVKDIGLIHGFFDALEDVRPSVSGQNAVVSWPERSAS